MNEPTQSGGLTRPERAKIYNRLKRRLGYAELGMALVFLLMLVTGRTTDLRDFAYRFGGGPMIWVLVYFTIVAAVFELITLPLGVVSGYVVEKRFGLSNQTFRAFAIDLVKAWAVGYVLSLIGIETLYLLLRKAGPWWWIWAGLVFTLFFVILAQLAPVVIFPIFFKFKEIRNSELTERITAMCRDAGAPVMGVYEWDLSTKTRKANAAVVGWGPTRRVVLADSLLAHFTASEIEVVLAHELAHHKFGHIRWLLVLQAIITFAAFFVADFLFRLIGQGLGFEHLDDVAGMPLLLLVFILVSLLAMPVANGFSRRLERQADRYALDVTGLSGSFISAMERLSALNLSEKDPHPVVEFLFYSHPSPARRIEAAKVHREKTRPRRAFH